MLISKAKYTSSNVMNELLVIYKNSINAGANESMLSLCLIYLKTYYYEN